MGLIDGRIKNLIVIIDAVCSKYSLLPTEFLERGNTLDIQMYIIAERERERQQRKAQNQSTADTYTGAELQELYSQWQELK